MPGRSGENAPNLHERTIDAMNQILERALGYVTGLEKIAVDQAVKLLYPRVERRVLQATEEELRLELKNLQMLVDKALAEPELARRKGTSAGRRQRARVKRGK